MICLGCLQVGRPKEGFLTGTFAGEYSDNLLDSLLASCEKKEMPQLQSFGRDLQPYFAGHEGLEATSLVADICANFQEPAPAKTRKITRKSAGEPKGSPQAQVANKRSRRSRNPARFDSSPRDPSGSVLPFLPYSYSFGVMRCCGLVAMRPAVCFLTRRSGLSSSRISLSLGFCCPTWCVRQFVDGPLICQLPRLDHLHSTMRIFSNVFGFCLVLYINYGLCSFICWLVS
jgi:hypothetical protein